MALRAACACLQHTAGVGTAAVGAAASRKRRGTRALVPVRALCVFLQLTAAVGFAAPRPNFVVLLTDDQDALLGSTSVMPKLRRHLVDAGISFRHGIANTPVCCPSRSSLLTGKYTHNHGAVNNTLRGGCASREWSASAEVDGVAVHLQRLGYRTLYAGKYLNMYGDKGTGTGAASGIAYVPPGWSEWYALRGNSRYYNYTISNNGVAERHGDAYAADYLTDVLYRRASAFIREATGTAEGKPEAGGAGGRSASGDVDAAVSTAAGEARAAASAVATGTAEGKPEAAGARDRSASGGVDGQSASGDVDDQGESGDVGGQGASGGVDAAASTEAGETRDATSAANAAAARPAPAGASDRSASGDVGVQSASGDVGVQGASGDVDAAASTAARDARDASSAVATGTAEGKPEAASASGRSASGDVDAAASTAAGEARDAASASGSAAASPPFLLWIGTPACHAGFTPAPQYVSTAAGAKAPRTPNWNLVLPTRHQTVRSLRPMGAREVGESDEIFARRLGTLRSVDDLVGGIVDALERAGQRDRTFFFYTSDHGFHLGQNAMGFDKRQLYETDIRVPYFVAGPGVPRGVVRDEPISHVDLAPTLVELAGGRVPDEWDGRSYAELLRTEKPMPWRRDALVQYFGEGRLETCGASYTRYAALPDGSMRALLARDYLPAPCDGENNTYTCVRRVAIGEGINDIFCRFTCFGDAGPGSKPVPCPSDEAEGYGEYYDLLRDPWQLHNAARQLSASKRHKLETRAKALGACSGQAQCR